MGEGDGLPDGAAPWRRLFGEPWFSQVLQKTENGKQKIVLHILGLHTAWCPGPGGPVFQVGDAGRCWLARELTRLDPEIPLLILSHAPLSAIYRPWQQWTVDSPEVLALLSRFPQVLCLHGHAHNAGVSGQWPAAIKGKSWVEVFSTENRKPKTENPLNLSLPATAWPGPQAMQGTPAHLAPGLGPAGCGWGMLSVAASSIQFQPRIWQA